MYNWDNEKYATKSKLNTKIKVETLKIHVSLTEIAFQTNSQLDVGQLPERVKGFTKSKWKLKNGTKQEKKTSRGNWQ